MGVSNVFIPSVEAGVPLSPWPFLGTHFPYWVALSYTDVRTSAFSYCFVLIDCFLLDACSFLNCKWMGKNLREWGGREAAGMSERGKKSVWNVLNEIICFH